MSGQIRIGRVVDAGTPEGDEAVQEVADQICRQFQYGASAPTSNTPGTIYFKQGTTSSDAVTVYLKVDGEWWGG